MNMPSKISKDPLSWKEVGGGLVILVSLSGIFVQGGMILEQQRSTSKAVETLTNKMAILAERQAGLALEIETRRGIDALQSEQISNIREQLNRGK